MAMGGDPRMTVCVMRYVGFWAENSCRTRIECQNSVISSSFVWSIYCETIHNNSAKLSYSDRKPYNRFVLWRGEELETLAH
jgi:hypothetical protein